MTSLGKNAYASMDALHSACPAIVAFSLAGLGRNARLPHQLDPLLEPIGVANCVFVQKGVHEACSIRNASRYWARRTVHTPTQRRRLRSWFWQRCDIDFFFLMRIHCTPLLFFFAHVSSFIFFQRSGRVWQYVFPQVASVPSQDPGTEVAQPWMKLCVSAVSCRNRNSSSTLFHQASAQRKGCVKSRTL